MISPNYGKRRRSLNIKLKSSKKRFGKSHDIKRQINNIKPIALIDIFPSINS